MKYSLVNPYITGSLETSSNAKDEFTAAREIYGRISKHFKNNVPRFFFTLHGGEGDKMYHFQVSEKKLGKEVQYVIKEAKATNNGTKKLLDFVQSKKQNGGGAFDDSSSDSSSNSSSDSSSSPYRVPTYVSPIREFLYMPMLYQLDVYADEYDVYYEVPLGTISLPVVDTAYYLIGPGP